MPRLVYLAMALLAFALLAWWSRRRPRGGAPRKRAVTAKTSTSALNPPKPLWVHKEVLRLKALMPRKGCRKIAEVFNHLHQTKRGMTVGKTFVASALQGKEEEIARLRQKMKQHKPRPVPKNLIWAMDLTFVAEGAGSRPVLGLLDHGTRACLALRALPTKSSIALLRCLLDAIENCGRPRFLRTDNEAVFTSKLFRFGLLLLGVRHQRTAPFCPWQNGRIERFFGTFKRAIRAWHELAGLPGEISEDLATFRAYYNHIRFHQHLDGRTPAMAWSGSSPTGQGRPAYFSEWNGILAGFLFAT